MHPEKLLSQHPLKNGLALEFWDLSRPLLGDRWQVVVEARVPVAVTADTVPPDLRPQLDRLISVLGKTLVFSKQEVRHFVPAAAVAALLEQIKDQLLASLRGYLGHPEFAARFIRKKYADYQESHRY